MTLRFPKFLSWPPTSARRLGRRRPFQTGLASVVLAAALLWTFAPIQAFAQESDWSLRLPVSGSDGDAEEFIEASRRDADQWPAGFSYLQSSDLELAFDPAHGPQIVGLHFSDVKLPAGARIEEAVVVFTSDSAESGPVQLQIAADSDVEPDPFRQDPEGEGSADLSSRTLTSASVPWQPEPWTAGGEYRSPDLAVVIEELVNRPGWRSGGEIVLLISPLGSAGGGHRSAFSFDGRADRAPRLLIRLEMQEQEEVTPRAGAGEDQGEDQEAPSRSEADREEAEREEAERAGPPHEEVEREEVQVTPVVPDAPVASERAGGGATDEGVGREAGEPIAEDAAGSVRPDPGRERFEMTPSHARGLRGSVLISDYGFGSTVVTLLLNNPEPSATYAVAIHSGECGASGRRVAALESVSGARAFSSSLVAIPFEELVSGNYHVNVSRTITGYKRIAGCAALGG